MQSLLDQREELLKSIQPPFTQQEKELGKKLVELDQKLNSYYKNKSRKFSKIKKLHMKKESNQKYTNPYESMPVDGLFYDKQK